jgi:hypothetical protein
LPETFRKGRGRTRPSLRIRIFPLCCTMNWRGSFGGETTSSASPRSLATGVRDTATALSPSPGHTRAMDAPNAATAASPAIQVRSRIDVGP